MEHPTTPIAVVPKEDISSLNFPGESLYDNPSEMSFLNAALSRAIILGNTQKQKVKIYFKDAEGVKMTETTIWAVTDKSVVLKKGVFIPIGRIIDISAY